MIIIGILALMVITILVVYVLLLIAGPKDSPQIATHKPTPYIHYAKPVQTIILDVQTSRRLQQARAISTMIDVEQASRDLDQLIADCLDNNFDKLTTVAIVTTAMRTGTVKFTPGPAFTRFHRELGAIVIANGSVEYTFIEPQIQPRLCSRRRNGQRVAQI